MDGSGVLVIFLEFFVNIFLFSCLNIFMNSVLIVWKSRFLKFSLIFFRLSFVVVNFDFNYLF